MKFLRATRQRRSRFAGFNGEEFVSADRSIAAMVSEREFIHTMCHKLPRAGATNYA